MNPIPKRGRPTGRLYEYNRNIRLTGADREDVERLAAKWRCTEVEAIRRAVRETAEREEVK